MCMWFCVGVPMGTCSLGWVLVYLCVRSSGSTGLATYVYGLTAQTRDIWICSIRWRAPSITVLLQCHPKASSKPFVPAPCSVMWPTSMPKRNESLAHELDAARRVLLCVKTVMKGKRERKKESDNESIHCWLIWKRLQLTHKHCKKNYSYIYNTDIAHVPGKSFKQSVWTLVKTWHTQISLKFSDENKLVSYNEIRHWESYSQSPTSADTKLREQQIKKRCNV